MPRSSRHKSSKHSSRNATDYSDSEKESSAKDRKSKEESVSRVSKESGSSEKRKHDSKEKRENVEEYYSSKRRKERIDEGPIDRWNGGGEDERGDGSRKSKDKSGESKSRRREEESEEAVKKNGGSSEGKHRDSSSRKEGREGVERDREKDRERERKGKEGRGQRIVEAENSQEARQVSERNELSAHDRLQSPEPENQPDRRIRRRKEDSRDGDKDQDVEDIHERKVFSRDDVSKDGRKDEKLKDKRYKDSYRENLGKESRQHDEKQKDEHSVKDHISSMSDEKKLRDDMATKTWQKKSKPQDGNDPDYDHDRDRDYDLGRDRDRENRSRGRDRERERDRDRYRERNRDWDHDRDREQNVDNDGMHSNDHKYKDSRGRKASPDDHDDYDDIKLRDSKTNRYEMDKKSTGGSRVEADFDTARSRSRQSHIDNNARSTRQKPSPSDSSHGTGDEYRQFKVEESKFIEGTPDQNSLANSLKGGAGHSGSTDRGFKFKSNGKPTKMEDGPSGDFSLGRSSSSKASPMGLADRSPSSTSVERRYRTGVRRSVDIEESGKRMSESRELPSTEERPRRNLSFEKPVVDEPTPADASYYNRTSQGNFALNPPPSGFRGRVGSPSLLGSHEEDSRNKAGARYRSSGDPNYGRGQGNAWRGNPNWSSPLPNGFIPYPHVPPHAGFQSMMPQFPSPPLFGVRPSLEMNHPRMPYHIPDADRFSSHLQMGWQNVMDGASHANLHGWDGNNNVFTNEPHMYGGPEWDRHHMNGRGWEAGGEQNGDVNMDLHKASPKVEFPLQSSVDAEHSGERSQVDTNPELPLKNNETNSTATYLESDSNKSLSGSTQEKPTEDCTTDDDCVDVFCQVYLAKFDNPKEMAGPELYGQFASVFNVEESPITEATSVLVNLKDGGRAVRKRDIGFSSPSLFPASNDSIYKRAMGIYKKQKVGSGFMSNNNNGLMDSTMVSETKLLATSADDMEKETRPSLDFEQSLNSNQNKADVRITADPDMSGAIDSVMSQEVHMHDSTPPGLKEVPALPSSHGSPAKEIQVGGGTAKDEMPSEPISSDDKKCVKVIDSNEDTDIAHSLSDCSSLDEKIKKETTNAVDVGTQNISGNVPCDPMLISDGSRSPRETGDLKPELNESESAVISRIHHSPESTH